MEYEKGKEEIEGGGERKKGSDANPTINSGDEESVSLRHSIIAS